MLAADVNRPPLPIPTFEHKCWSRIAPRPRRHASWKSGFVIPFRQRPRPATNRRCGNSVLVIYAEQLPRQLVLVGFRFDPDQRIGETSRCFVICAGAPTERNGARNCEMRCAGCLGCPLQRQAQCSARRDGIQSLGAAVILDRITQWFTQMRISSSLRRMVLASTARHGDDAPHGRLCGKGANRV